MRAQSFFLFWVSMPSVTFSALRVCLDRVSRSQNDERADIYAAVTLDNSRGFRCAQLAIVQRSSVLSSRSPVGFVHRSLYHEKGWVSHHTACSMISTEHCTKQTPSNKDGCDEDGCIHVVECPYGLCMYSSKCDASRSPCYSFPEHNQISSQPLWCCDFDDDSAARAHYARVQLYDEGRLGDDRMGNASVAMSSLLAASQAVGFYNVTAALEGVHAPSSVSLWAGFVDSELQRERRSKGQTHISYWGAYGPSDTSALAKHRRRAATRLSIEQPGRPWMMRQVRARQRQEWQKWQDLPLLGAEEQTPEDRKRRWAFLTSIAAGTTEIRPGESEICIVTTATGSHYNGSRPLGAALLRNKHEFCKTCGYRCLLSTSGDHRTQRPAKWDKILAVHDALRSCSIVLHVDADVVIRRAFQLPSLARTWLTASRDFDGLNSGVLLVRRTRQARELLQRAWQMRSFNTSFSAEQNALRLLLRRPYHATSRSRAGMVTILEGLVEYPFYGSPFLSKLENELNFTAPLSHAAGCTAKKIRVDTGVCDKLLLSQLPRGGVGSCEDIEKPYKTRNNLLLQHLQEVGATNLGRRWMRGRDVRIKYTDQKGADHDGWWYSHPGCSAEGCDDPDARVRAEKASRRAQATSKKDTRKVRKGKKAKGAAARQLG